MKAKLFRLGCGVLIAALLASAAGCGGKTDGEQTTALIPDETTAAQTTAAEETTTAAAAADDLLKKAQEGDTVTFGAFEQDNNDANGKEPIEWIVLAKRETALLLLSRRALSSRPYHISEDETVTWETCTLRQWLNDEFYKAAFSEQEQAQIKTTAVVNEDNPEYGTPGGRNTEDKVFLLSLAENQQYASSDETRIHTPTAAAIAQGFDDETPGEQDGCSWWLRSPGDFKGSACLVTQFGVAHNLGSYSNRKNGVVPALWVETQPAPAETTQRPAATEAPAAQKASAEWAGAYQNYLLDVLAKMEEEDYDNDDFRFGLIELNDDDVPELWFTDGIGAHGPKYVILTCRGGKATAVFEEGYNELEYYEKQSVFYIFGIGGATSGAGSYYKMTDSGYDVLDEFEYEYQWEDETKANWTLNGKTEVIASDDVNKKIDGLRQQYDERYSKKATVIDEKSGFPLTADSVKKNCK